MKKIALNKNQTNVQFVLDYYNAIVSNNLIYEALCRDLHILDITNPTQPTLISSLSMNSAGDFRCIFQQDSLILMMDLGTHLFIVNISDIYHPRLLSSYQTSGMLTEEVYVIGNHVYITCNFAGVEIIDVSNPENPQQASMIKINMVIKKIHCSDNCVFILTDQHYGIYHFFIYDISNPLDPAFVLDYQPDHSADVFVDNNIIYLIGGYYLEIYRFTYTDISPASLNPAFFTLSTNYPNPFNAQTIISYSLPQASAVTLDIYDVLGREVQTLFDGEQPAGEHSAIWNADGFSSGTYFYKITTDSFERTEKMTLLK